MGKASVGLKARVQAFYDEFPFLKRYVDIAMVGENPRVSRVNLDLLDQSGRTLNWSKERHGNWFDAQGEKLFFLLGTNGKELAAVRPIDAIRTPRKNKLWGIFPRAPMVTKVDSESVFEAIQRLPDPDQIRYIIEIEDRRPGWRREMYPGDPGYSIIVYKVPAGEPFSNWLSRLNEIAKQELSIEIGEIDRLK